MSIDVNASNVKVNNTLNQQVTAVRPRQTIKYKGSARIYRTCYNFDAFNHRISCKNSHVAVYLGNGLILQNSPYTDNGGVNVTSLRDPMWNSRSKYPEVHHFNGIARRVF